MEEESTRLIRQQWESDARQEYQATPEQWQSILRHILPRPEALAAIAEVFGTDNSMYAAMEGVVANDEPVARYDLDSFDDFLMNYGFLFDDSLPVYDPPSDGHVD